jgi:hypothetical protein
LAGKSASRSVITQSNVVDSKSFVNVLPDFGPVDIETTVQSELGGTLFKPEIKKSTLFIVQWKEPFFFTALAASFIWYVSRRRPSKEGQKRKEPSLLWLAIKALTKYLKKRFSKSSKSAK